MTTTTSRLSLVSILSSLSAFFVFPRRHGERAADAAAFSHATRRNIRTRNLLSCCDLAKFNSLNNNFILMLIICKCKKSLLFTKSMPTLFHLNVVVDYIRALQALPIFMLAIVEIKLTQRDVEAVGSEGCPWQIREP